MNDMTRWSSSLPLTSPSLASRLLRAAHEIEARCEQALATVGLSLAKFSVLSHLVDAKEALPLSQLADRSSCCRSNMTQLVDRLEADGLVERVDDPEDRRSVRAVLTSEGRMRHGEGARILAEAEEAAVVGLSEDDRTLLTRLIGLVGLRR